MPSDDAWAPVPTGRQRNKRPQNARPQAVADRPLGMRKGSPVLQTTGSKASTPNTPSTATASAASTGNVRLGQANGSRNAQRQQQPKAPSYGVLLDDAEDLDDAKPSTTDQRQPTTAPTALRSASPNKRKLSAQEAAIPTDTVEKLLAAARAMYQQNMGVKAAAKKFHVTVQGLRHFWDTNGGSEVCRSPAPKGKPGCASAASNSQGIPPEQSGGPACPYYDDDDDDQWY